MSDNLRAVNYKLEEIFDSARLKDKGIMKENVFLYSYEPFFDNLKTEVAGLTLDEIKYLVDELNQRIEKARAKDNLTPTGVIFKKHRIRLRNGLFDIYQSTKREDKPNQIPSPVLSSAGVKAFSDYLLDDTRVELANRINEEFKIEKGKAISLLLLALQNKNLIDLGNRQGKNIYASLQALFNRDIGTYQSIFDLKYSESKHKNDLEGITKRLDYILSGIKK